MSNDINEKLTTDELKKIKGFENSTDEEAIQQIEVIERLTNILFDIYTEEQLNKNPNE